MRRKPSFKGQIEDVLAAHGFTRAPGHLHRTQSGVRTIVDVECILGVSYVNVGFWLVVLGGPIPTRTNHTHLYYRLESLFPQYLDLICAAGVHGEPAQDLAIPELCKALAGELGLELRELGTEEALRIALRDGRLNKGLVRWEAREFLSNVPPSL